MTKEFYNYTVNLTRGGKSYKVQSIYDEDIFAYVSLEDVEKIANQTSYDNDEISIILGMLEIMRKDASTQKHSNRRIHRDVMISTVTLFLKYYSPEYLIEILEQFRYYELYHIFNSQDPIEELIDVV